MEKYHIGKFNILTGWQEINPASISTEKPLVLGFNGNGGKDIESAVNLNRLIQTFLPEYLDKIDILTVAYSHDANAIYGTLQLSELEEIANEIFIKRLTKDGQRLDLHTAKKNMRGITVFSHCHGATIMFRINEILTEKMEILRYTENEISEILKQIFMVGFAPQTSDNRNSGLYVKSFDDEVCGGTYQKEIITYNLINLYETSLEKEKIKDERILNAISTPVKHSAAPYIGCGYPYRVKDMVHVYAQKLSLETDHPLRNILRDVSGRIASFPVATKHADVASLTIAEALRVAVENSIANLSECFVKLNMEAFETKCADLIVKGNNSFEELANYLNYMNENAYPRIMDIMHDNNITEQDIITGKVSMGTIKQKAVGSIDFSETIFKLMIDNARTAKGGYQYPNQPKPYTVAPINDAYGIVWSNGDVSSCSNVNQLMLTTLYTKIFKGQNISNSVMFMLEEVEGKRLINIANNFGSVGEMNAESFADLVKLWRKQYGFDKFDITLTNEQKYAIENLKLKFGIGETLNNIQNLGTNICGI